MVRILSIVWYKVLPARFGGQKGIALFNEYLSKYATLACLCSDNNVSHEKTSYQVIPKLPTGKAQFAAPGVWSLIAKQARDFHATHLIIEHPYHAIAGVKASRSYKTKLIIHSHNIESSRFKQLGKWWWRILFVYEKWAHRKAHLSLFKSDADLRYALKHFRLIEEQCMVVPYGTLRPKTIDIGLLSDLRSRHGISTDEKILLFAGTLDYSPNREAVYAINDLLCPLLDKAGFAYRVLICGKNFPKRSKLHERILLVGEVDDLDPYYQATSVFINPVLKGGGVQTKNIDAISHNCNLVCFRRTLDKHLTELATIKIFDAEDGNWQMFYEQIIESLKTQRATPEAFYDFYSWDRIAQTLISRIKNI